MGNLESKFEDPNGSNLRYHQDMIAILAYGSKQVLNKTNFASSHLPCTGTFVLSPMKHKIAHSWSNKELLEFYDPVYLQNVVEIGNGTHYYADTHPRMDLSRYFFIPQLHKINPIEFPGAELFEPKNKEVDLEKQVEYLSLSLMTTAGIYEDNQHFYKFPVYKRWAIETGIETSWGVAPPNQNQLKYAIQSLLEEQRDPNNVLGKLLPFNIDHHCDREPSSSGIVQVLPMTMLEFETLSQRINHYALPPVHIACITLTLDTNEEARSLEAIKEMCDELSELVIAGTPLPLTDQTIHIFIQGDVAQLDQDIFNTNELTQRLACLGFQQVQIHHVVPGVYKIDSQGVGKVSCSISYEDHVNKSLWPEIFRTYFYIQSQKALHPIKSTNWISYSQWPPTQHITHINHSKLKEEEKIFNIATPSYAYDYDLDIVIRSIASVYGSNYLHSDPKIQAKLQDWCEDHKQTIITKYQPFRYYIPYIFSKLRPNLPSIELQNTLYNIITDDLNDNTNDDQLAQTNPMVEYGFSAFICNRYKLGSRLYIPQTTKYSYSYTTDEQSTFRPLESLLAMNINPDSARTPISSLVFNKPPSLYSPSTNNFSSSSAFNTTVFSLFPNVDTPLHEINYKILPRSSDRFTQNNILTSTTVQNEIPYANFTTAQRNLISQQQITPVKCTIDYLYRNDNTLSKHKYERDGKEFSQVDSSDQTQKELRSTINGPRLQWFAPMRWLYGVQLFPYDLSFCFNPTEPLLNITDDPKQLFKDFKIPSLLQNTYDQTYRFKSIIHDYDEIHCNAHLLSPMHVIFIIHESAPIHEIFLQHDPTAVTDLDQPLDKFRRLLNEECQKQIIENVFKDKLILGEQIKDLWTFHIVPEFQLAPLLNQIQYRSIQQRLKLYAQTLLQ